LPFLPFLLLHASAHLGNLQTQGEVEALHVVLQQVGEGGAEHVVGGELVLLVSHEPELMAQGLPPSLPELQTACSPLELPRTVQLGLGLFERAHFADVVPGAAAAGLPDARVAVLVAALVGRRQIPGIRAAEEGEES